MTEFADLIGQQQAVELLSRAVEKNRVAPAYLFAGPDGVGRSLAARYFAKLLLEENIQKQRKLENHPDFLWVEPTYLHQGKLLTVAEAAEAGLKRRARPQIRLEQVRDISRFLNRPPLEAPRCVVAIAQAETMAEAAANALLKTLEEPGKATLILIAPSPDSLLPTLVSRCQRIPFYRLSPEAIKQVLEKEGHAEVLKNLAVLEMAQGSPGQAIASIKQLEEIPEELCQELACKPKNNKRALELAKEIDRALDAESQIWLIDYLQHCYWQTQADVSAIRQLEKARQYLLAYAQPRLVWEVTLLGMSKSQ
ncbi:MAG: AAA family ATPase [Oscillatoria sp. SIO1A7]|nr:AAA family ATPase [Oscillatoria sp. SIO1A7]